MIVLDQSSRAMPVAENDGQLESRENPETRKIREALGAIAVAGPAVYWLYLAEDMNWHVHREGEFDACSYPTREQALQSLRLAVIRCASYCLFLQGGDGRFAQEFRHWPPRPIQGNR